MSRKIKSTIFLILMLGVVVFSAMAVSAAELGQIDVTVNNDATKPVGVVPGLLTKLTDPSGNDTGMLPDATLATQGIYEFQNLTTAGSYNVLFYTAGSTSTTGASIDVAIKLSAANATTPKITKASLTWVDPAAPNKDKSGAIGGFTTDGTAGLSGVTVKAYNSKAVTYITTSGTNGAYKMYLPADNYTLVVVGKDNPGADLYKNLSSAITVIKGQTIGPLTDLSARTTWGPGENANGLVVLGLDGNDKTISGFALPNTTVSAYVYTGSDTTGKYQFLASATVGTNAAARKLLAAQNITSTTQGAYTIKLDTYYPNQKIAVRVKDSALNVYEDGTYVTSAITGNTMNLATDATKARIDQPIVITFSDPTSSALTTFLKGKIANVTATDSAGNVSLSGKYTVSPKTGVNTITIAAGTLSTTGAYVVKVSATGYTDGILPIYVNPSNTAPYILGGGTATSTTGITTAKGTTTVGATKITIAKFDGGLTTLPGTSSLYYRVGTSSAVTVYKNNPLSSYSGYGFAAFTNGNEVTGLDLSTNNYVDIIQATNPQSSGVILGYKRVGITSSNISTFASGLTGLVVSTDAAIDLTPVFDVGTDSYTLNTTGAYVNVKPTFSGTGVSVTVDGAPVTTSGTIKKVTLNYGTTKTIDVVVSKTGYISKTYRIVVTNPGT